MSGCHNVSCQRQHLRPPPAFLPAAWEGLFLEQIGAIRAREATFIRRMARVKACNMGLSYAIAPLVSCRHECRVCVLVKCIPRSCAVALNATASSASAPSPLRPQSALAAFGVARATSPGRLTVPNVFFALALLALPKLYRAEFFVHAVRQGQGGSGREEEERCVWKVVGLA